MYRDVLKLVGFNFLVLFLLVLVYSAVRLFLQYHVDFAWYDLDFYFLVLIPFILCFFTVNWFIRLYDHFFNLEPDRLYSFKTVTTVFFAASLITSQYMLDRHLDGVMEINHPKEVDELRRQRYFDIDPNQMEFILPYAGLLYEQKLKPNYRRRSISSSNTMLQKAYVVFKIEGTDNHVWWGKTYYDSFDKRKFNHQEKLDEFLKHVRRDVYFHVPDGAYFFTSASYLKNKKEYLKAIQIQSPLLKMKNVTVLEVGIPDFQFKRKISLSLMLVVMIFGMIWLVINQRKYLIIKDPIEQPN